MLNDEIYKALIWHEKRNLILEFRFFQNISKFAASMAS